MIGLARGALDAAIGYVKERKQFGKAIAEFQAVQHQIARAVVEVEAARLTVYNAARLRDAGKPFLTEAAVCKILSSEVAERVASLAVNLFGGNGFVKEYPVEKFYRDAKIGQIYEGTSNLQLPDHRQAGPRLARGPAPVTLASRSAEQDVAKTCVDRLQRAPARSGASATTPAAGSGPSDSYPQFAVETSSSGWSGQQAIAVCRSKA